MSIWPMKSIILNNVDGDYLGKLSSTIKEVAKNEDAQEILRKSQYCTRFNGPSDSSATKDHAGFDQSYSRSYFASTGMLKLV